MSSYGDFDRPISIVLKRDEAIVLFWWLTREAWAPDPKNLRQSFEHPAELHSLKALLQELIPPLMDTGAPEAAGIEHAAREHLMQRHS